MITILQSENLISLGGHSGLILLNHELLGALKPNEKRCLQTNQCILSREVLEKLMLIL